LNSPDTHFALSKLIELTNERDVIALELLLAETILDIMLKMDNNSTKAVVIYNSVDIRKKQFSGFSVGQKVSEEPLSDSFKEMLIQCISLGKHCIYSVDSKPQSTLYPLKNSLGQTIAVIVLEGFLCEPQEHKTITMLLQIYENFTTLINDNERDALTGLLNRKTFELKINKILARLLKTNQRKDDNPQHVNFLAIFDIDHFKNVNDQFGHLIGDEVLLMFSQLMTKTFRINDPLFRFGGEEFVGVFECSNYRDIQSMLNRFRESVSQFVFPQVGRVTVSIGYTEILAGDVSSHLIDNADQALYFAKNNGRNQICHHGQLIADGILEKDKKIGDIELF
jgi:diguanylate cyclase (GGDEF)-like protein